MIKIIVENRGNIHETLLDLAKQIAHEATMGGHTPSWCYVELNNRAPDTLPAFSGMGQRTTLMHDLDAVSFDYAPRAMSNAELDYTRGAIYDIQASLTSLRNTLRASGAGPELLNKLRAANIALADALELLEEGGRQ
jgi:hypothetical protein